MLHSPVSTVASAPQPSFSGASTAHRSGSIVNQPSFSGASTAHRSGSIVKQPSFSGASTDEHADLIKMRCHSSVETIHVWANSRIGCLSSRIGYMSSRNESANSRKSRGIRVWIRLLPLLIGLLTLCLMPSEVFSQQQGGGGGSNNGNGSNNGSNNGNNS
ncbi:MAG: hypothetical protein ACKO6M_04690, partial [Bacteroidota bacterium]